MSIRNLREEAQRPAAGGNDAWQPREYGLWTAAAPFAETGDELLTEHFLPSDDGIARLTDVAEPTITFFPVCGSGPHPAVLVCPGGAYELLAWDLEGRDICSYFNSIGFAAFLLKYRCPKRRAAAHADAARAMRLIRAHAEFFGIHPAQLGCLGFSAGAHLTASIAAPAESEPYPATDEADRLPFRPNFIGLIYPAYLCDCDAGLTLHPEFRIDADTPPAFLVQTADDPAKVENALGWCRALKNASVPAELHIFSEGGHGYGIRRSGKPVADWPLLAADWFRRQVKMP